MSYFYTDKLLKKTASLSVFLLLLFLLSFVFTSVGAGAEQKGLKFGVVPFKSPRAVVELYGPIAALLTEALGENVQVVTAKSYEQYMQRVYAGQYDIIVLGSTFYFKAHDKAGYLAVARGYPPFYAGIVVLKSSGVTTLEQLHGKSIAAVNSIDRAGYGLQKKAFAAKKMDIEQDLTVHFRGDFDSVVYAVLGGQDDAGAIRLDTLERPAFAEIKDRLSVIYTSPANPQFPFAVRPGLDASLRQKIAETLVSIGSQQTAEEGVLQKLSVQGIEKISSSDLEELRLSRQRE